MKHLSILVPNGQNNLSSIVGPFKIFNRANHFYNDRGLEKVFEIELVGLKDSVPFYDGLFSVNPQKNLKDIFKTNLIIIPSLNHNYTDAIKGNEEMIDWIDEQYRLGTEIASICTGAFLLASTGILDGKSCSTHWAAADNFRLMFPDVHLETDQLITDENGIYTNGGAYSFLNLMIYLVEKYYDRETAVFCSKVFQIDIDRSMQSEFSIFNGQKKHDDLDILEAQNYIEDHYYDKISMEFLSKRFNIGRRNFDRRFKKSTGFTPLDYIQRVKIEVAKKSFENTRKTVNEVMYDVGYTDGKAFREVFRKITSLSPLEYKNRYNKDAILI